MAHVSQQTIAELNAGTSIERLVAGRGIQLTERDDVLVGACPWCGQAESLVVRRPENTWACDPCGLSGGVVDWVRSVEGVSQKHAVDLLRADALGEPGDKVVRKATVPKLGGVVDADADPHVIVRAVIDYYHNCLKQSPEALAYLTRRGLRDASMIEQFQLGFSNRTLGFRIPANNRKAGASIRSVLSDVGLLKSTGHELFRGSVVFPVLDGEQVVQCYGRKITGNLRKDTPDHLWLPGPRQGVWNRPALSGEEFILCESIIDALTFWCAGYRHVTAVGGPNALTDELVGAIGDSPVRRVLIAFDRDPEGDAGAQAVAERLMAVGTECLRVVLPSGQDVNSYYLGTDCSSEALGTVLRASQWLGKGSSSPAHKSTIQPTAEVLERESPSGLIDDSATPTPLCPAAQGSVDRAVEISDAPDSHVGDKALPEGHTQPGPTGSVVADDGEEESTDEALGHTTALTGRPVLGAEPTLPHGLRIPASPIPTSPPTPLSAPKVESNAREIVIRLGGRRWRVRGLDRCMIYDQLRVNLLCELAGRVHVDTFDLYSAKHRAAFIANAAIELAIKEATVKRDLGHVLLQLEELQDRQIKATFEEQDEPYEMTEPEKTEAMSLLRSSDLLGDIVADLTACGLVGEDTNKLVVYLAAVSRKLQDPLAILIQSSSAAGKSSLLRGALALVPPEDRVMYSAMTGQSLFYMGESNLRHRVLAIAEDHGVAQAAYALKLLQSEGELTIASTGNEASTGRLVSHAYRVEGPVALMLTSTAIDIDEELLNRCLVVAVDEERPQTRAIHDRQRQGQTL